MRANERITGSAVLGLIVIVFSAVIVLTRFGWYAALNAVIPFIIAVLWLSVLALSSWGAGNLVCRRWFTPDQPVLERTVFQLLAGTAVLIAAAGLLGVAHILIPVLLLAVLGGFCCHGALLLYRQGCRPSCEAWSVRHWSWLVIGIAGAVSLAAATTFAPFYDQWNYHLAFPYQWLRAGSLVTFPRHAYSFFPSDMGLLYLYALAGPGAWAAQVTHWWMGALTAAGSASIARRLGASVGGQILATAVFAATPSVIQVGALAGADLGVAAFATGAVMAMLRWRSEPRRAVQWAMISGAFAGLAAGSKYLALASVVAPTAIAAAVLSSLKTPDGKPLVRRSARAFLAFVMAVTALVGPWLARNALQTGNPVYPYFAGIFNPEVADHSRTDDRVASGIGNFALTSDTFGTAVSLGTFTRRGHAGDIGPVYLWLMPLICIWMWFRRRDTDALLVFGLLALGVAMWAVGPPLGRYLLPSLALIAALAGTAWSELVDSYPTPLRYILGLILLLVLVGNCSPVRGEYLGNQLACFLGFQTDEEYLEDNLTQLEAFRTVNADLPVDAKVLLVGEPRAYGIDRAIVVEDHYRTPLLVELAEESSSASDITRGLRSLGITHILVNDAEANRIAAADGRADFLACSSAEARVRLDQFLADGVTPVTSGRSWKIGALSED